MSLEFPSSLPERGLRHAGPRRDDEGLYEYLRRVWEAEYEAALSSVEDPETRAAFNALRAIQSLNG